MIKKEKIIGVRLNEKELKIIKEKAKKEGMFLSAYLREKALKSENKKGVN